MTQTTNSRPRLIIEFADPEADAAPTDIHIDLSNPWMYDLILAGLYRALVSPPPANELLLDDITEHLDQATIDALTAAVDDHALTRLGEAAR